MVKPLSVSVRKHGADHEHQRGNEQYPEHETTDDEDCGTALTKVALVNLAALHPESGAEDAAAQLQQGGFASALLRRGSAL